MNLNAIGLYIANLRKERKLTQAELANFLNVSDKTISKWESGIGIPEPASLIKLADFFHVKVDDILRAGLTEEKDNRHIIMVIDKSGSMYSLKSDTVGGFNQFLSEQQKMDDGTTLTVLFFDSQPMIHQYEQRIKETPKLHYSDYNPSGSTALYDAVGYALDDYMGHEKEKPALVVIMTDGLENSSRKYTKSMIKDRVEHLKRKGWEFLFLGANFDVDSFADEIAIDKNRRAKFVQDTDGISSNFKVMSQSVKYYRESGSVSDDWDKDIKKDKS